ncbi:MAG: SulP family inorganic anion transporter [Bacteroidetes bacterium]|nr:SulP family inorganic anion transporter [Bacteroidota bacterium]
MISLYRRKAKLYRILWLRHDFPAGLSVFFVALPLCLGIALASGAPFSSGLLSGMVGGIIVSLLSGSSLSVSGPAAGLSTVVAAAILFTGDLSVFFLSVIIAGAFQLLLGVFRLGVIANYIPSSVIKGMLAAIGIILLSKQIPLALGYDQPDFWNSGFLTLFTSKNVLGNVESLNHHLSRYTIILSVIALLILIAWRQPFARKFKGFPSALVVVLACTLVNYLLPILFSDYRVNSVHLVQVPDNVFSSISFPDFTKFFSSTELWKYGIMMGMLATLETLLCIEAIDKLDRKNRVTPMNRELVAQGIGNMVCGLIGAIPMTAVIVRGAANIDAGARSRYASFTHGAFLLLSVAFLPFMLNKIPFAALSAILMITGYNLATPKLFKSIWKAGMKQFLPFIITIVIILATDLLSGVAIGLLISFVFVIRDNYHAEFVVKKTIQHETEVYLIKLHTNVNFLNKVKLKTMLDKIPPYSVLTIDGTDTLFIDYDILEIISEYESKAHDRHIEVHTPGIEKVNVTSIH